MQVAPPAGAALAAHARLILAVIIAAAFLDVVDFSVVQVALPTIQREFLAPLAESQWVTGVYGLTLAGFLMVSGRAATCTARSGCSWSESCCSRSRRSPRGSLRRSSRW